MTDEQINHLETNLKYSELAVKMGGTAEITVGFIENIRQMIDDIRTIQQQNKQITEQYEECRDDAVKLHHDHQQMRETLEWYESKQRYDAWNFTKEGILIDQGKRARNTLQSLQDPIRPPELRS